MLKFSKANTKLERLNDVPEIAKFLEGNRKVYSFDLLSGHTCPFANECLSKVIIENGKRKIKDGKNTKFRCFSASQEALYKNVYNLRKHNTDLIKQAKTTKNMAELIEKSMPKNAGVIRCHVAGDFLNEKYFLAWILTAKNNPDKLFYAYTKSLPYWIKNADKIPDNMILTASRGGRKDELITEENLRESVVVFSQEEAEDLNYEIDHNDSHAANPSIRDNSFALLIHGMQPKNSEASEALKKLKKSGVEFSYNRKKS